MKAFVAVTDEDWFEFLRRIPELDEVNFWQPSPSGRFQTIEPGGPLLFKLHYPNHFIVGGGFFTHYSVLPASLTWETFGEKNGAASLAEMRTRIEKYRRAADRPPSGEELYRHRVLLRGATSRVSLARGDDRPVQWGS